MPGSGVADDLEGHGPPSDVIGRGENEFVAWTDGHSFWHGRCIELDEDDVEFRGLTADEAASGCHAGRRCDSCGLPLSGNQNVAGP